MSLSLWINLFVLVTTSSCAIETTNNSADLMPTVCSEILYCYNKKCWEDQLSIDCDQESNSCSANKTGYLTCTPSDHGSGIVCLDSMFVTSECHYNVRGEADGCNSVFNAALFVGLCGCLCCCLCVGMLCRLLFRHVVSACKS